MDLDKLSQNDDDAFVEYAREQFTRLEYDADGDPTIASASRLRSLLLGALGIFDVSSYLRTGWSEIPAFRTFDAAKEFVRDLEIMFELHSLKVARASRLVVFETVVISENYKAHIRELVSKIKIGIDSADLPADKSDSLLQKLNIFLNELDKERTGLAALTAAFIQVGSAVGQSAEKLEPAMSLFERIMKAIGRGGSPMTGLPKSAEEQRQLPSPDADTNQDKEPE
jgi:hypothetical protein